MTREGKRSEELVANRHEMMLSVLDTLLLRQSVSDIFHVAASYSQAPLYGVIFCAAAALQRPSRHFTTTLGYSIAHTQNTVDY